MRSGKRSFVPSLRRAEWLAIGLTLLLMSGALLPLLLSASDNVLDDAERAKLRIIGAPGLLLGLGLLLCYPRSALRAGLNNLSMLALLLLPMASVLWSIGPSVTLRRAVALILATALAYVLAIRFTVRQQMILLAWIFGGTTVLSLLAPLFLGGSAFMPGESALRGVFVHKNVLGWFGAMTVAVGLAAGADPDRLMRRRGLVLISLGFAAVLLSTSATGLLASLAALATVRLVRFVATARPGIDRLARGMAVLVLCVAAGALLVLGLVPLLEALGKDATLTGRVPLWHEVDAAIARRPLLGYGFGAFWDKGNVIAWQIWGSQGWQAPHAHNGYRDLLLSSGLVGLGLFLFATARALGQGVALCTEKPDEGWILPILIIIIMLVLNLSESTFLKQNDLFWTLYTTAAISISNRYAALTRSVPRQTRLALTAT